MNEHGTLDASGVAVNPPSSELFELRLADVVFTRRDQHLLQLVLVVHGEESELRSGSEPAGEVRSLPELDAGEPALFGCARELLCVRRRRAFQTAGGEEHSHSR